MGNLDNDLTVSIGFGGEFTEVITGYDLHIGTRPYQQDALFVTGFVRGENHVRAKAFGVLCDGMGGFENGEKASAMAVEMLKKSLETLEDDENVAMFFASEVDRIDQSVLSECGGGGTTLTAVVIFGSDLYWVSVGDSRVYIIRGNDIVQTNRDHNYMMLLKERVRQGRITMEEAEKDPKADALISYVGAGRVRYIDTNEAPFLLNHGDIVLLCSDGLTKSLSPREIREIIAENYGDMETAAHALTLAAFDSGDGSKDNTSVVLMQYFE